MVSVIRVAITHIKCKSTSLKYEQSAIYRRRHLDDNCCVHLRRSVDVDDGYVDHVQYHTTSSVADVYDVDSVVVEGQPHSASIRRFQESKVECVGEF